MSAGDPWIGTAIDVSKWQSELPSLAGVLGVIARAGIGTKPDVMFREHIANARAAGKWVGAYWYNWGSLSVSDQVNEFIGRELSVGGVQLHAIDWEGSEGFTAAQTADFIRLYRFRTGEPIGLYASEGRFRDLGQDWNWIANYSREPIKHYDMWQYGPFRGVDGNWVTDRIIDLVKESSQVAQAPITDTVQKRVGASDRTTVYDLDGKTIVGALSAVSDRLSPYAAAGMRAIYIGTGVGTAMKLVLCKPDYVRDVVDPTQFNQGDLDAAKAEQKLADQAAIDLANAARDDALAQLDTAAATERERIAMALADDTADKVRTA